MASPRDARYWPGGIPAHIRCHPEPVGSNPLSTDLEVIKGWNLYLEESYVPPSSGEQDRTDYELNQRRRLISQWASMSQESRDAYFDRAPLPTSWGPPAAYKLIDFLKVSMPLTVVDGCYCMAPLQDSPRNRALWTKMRILGYWLDGSADGPFLPTAVAKPNPDSGDVVVTPETFMRWNIIESAQFCDMAMTREGTVVFTGGSILFADQEALDTGKLLMCDFANNGEIYESARIGIWLLQKLWLRRDDGLYEMDILRHSLVNAPVDMDPPLLDVMDELVGSSNYEGDIDMWMAYIERYAPGYLDMEKAGNGIAPDYDHSKFRSEQELMNVPRPDILLYREPGEYWQTVMG